MLEDAEVVTNGLLKAVLVRAQKGKRRAVEKAAIFLENMEIIT